MDTILHGIQGDLEGQKLPSHHARLNWHSFQCVVLGPALRGTGALSARCLYEQEKEAKKEEVRKYDDDAIGNTIYCHTCVHALHAQSTSVRVSLDTRSHYTRATQISHIVIIRWTETVITPQQITHKRMFLRLLWVRNNSIRHGLGLCVFGRGRATH